MVIMRILSLLPKIHYVYIHGPHLSMMVVTYRGAIVHRASCACIVKVCTPKNVHICLTFTRRFWVLVFCLSSERGYWLVGNQKCGEESRISLALRWVLKYFQQMAARSLVTWKQSALKWFLISILLLKCCWNILNRWQHLLWSSKK